MYEFLACISGICCCSPWTCRIEDDNWLICPDIVALLLCPVCCPLTWLLKIGSDSDGKLVIDDAGTLWMAEFAFCLFCFRNESVRTICFNCWCPLRALETSREKKYWSDCETRIQTNDLETFRQYVLNLSETKTWSEHKVLVISHQK